MRLRSQLFPSELEDSQRFPGGGSTSTSKRDTARAECMEAAFQPSQQQSHQQPQQPASFSTADAGECAGSRWRTGPPQSSGGNRSSRNLQPQEQGAQILALHERQRHQAFAEAHSGPAHSLLSASSKSEHVHYEVTEVEQEMSQQSRLPDSLHAPPGLSTAEEEILFGMLNSRIMESRP
mmetsp:Transcript_111242/g.248627  ORF Transcript_111242/g.248627 Transcript_111242/m.248627 type:complete len:179 (-) Transcript_111242:16-552(-)